MDLNVFIDVAKGDATSLEKLQQTTKQSKEIQFKPSVAQNAEQPSLAILGCDILIMIFYLIQDSSPKSLKALALVSSEFYHLAERSRYRHLALSLDSDKIDASEQCLYRLKKQNVLSAIRSLDISDPGEGRFTYPLLSTKSKTESSVADRYHGCINSISNLIPKMTGLRYIGWNYFTYGDHPVPELVLQALRSCPKVRLHAKVGGRYQNPLPVGLTREDNLDRLQNNPNLSKLRANITFCAAKDCLESVRPLKQILLSSPNLRSLALDISQPSSGCVVYGRPYKYCGFGFVGDEGLPPLEELSISGYPWGESNVRPGKEAYSWLDQTGHPGKGSEMDHWAQNFDWSRLRRLKTIYLDFALKIMPKLISLKEVDFTESWAKESITHFYRECPAALESIYVRSLQSITLQGILRHGSALRKLHLHTVEDYNGSWDKSAIDTVSLRNILNGCPLIEELFVDVARYGDWPWEVLDVLASFFRLRHLSVCFEIGVRHFDDPVKPYVTFQAAETLYKYLRSRSLKQPSIISRLHIYSGAPPPIGHGLPALWAFWPRQNSTEFICTLSERDDEAGKGVLEVECPRLPKKFNKKQLSYDWHKMMLGREHDQTLKVAYDGPASFVSREEDY
ncbi:hypothetical protein H2198_004787 [Neophaeococcomyces mojaviensis]|uniref:Uncharacterized protein n=1 Tax=Neophaeococcomyces mojaviensis TaxID=3383035 RepID=A0ACC3A8B4_9EURO|nr:hypothetical protein H2198_004787 [Knufia sp. JES_112]